MIFLSIILLGTFALEFSFSGSKQLVSAFSSDIEVNGNSELQEREGLLFYKGEVFTGRTIERFPKGNVYRSTQYRKGLKHGQMEEYGFTGAIKHRWNFTLGKKDGLQYGWYLEGPKKYVHEYKGGLFHGVNTEWFLAGNLFSKRTYKNGVEVATKIHFSTSELHTNTVTRDGAVYGLKTGDLCMDFKKDGEI